METHAHASTGPSAAADPMPSGDAARGSVGTLTARMVSLAESEALIAPWQALADGMAGPNVLAEPWITLPAMRLLGDAAPTLRLLTVWDGVTLIGVMPVHVTPRLGRLPLRTIGDWAHPNSFLSSITVRAGAESAFWDCALTALAAHADHPRMLSVSGVVEDSAIHAGLVAAAQRLSAPITIEQQTQRAFCAHPAGASAYWDATVRAKKRKELRRQWNRLGEEGALSVAALPDDAPVDRWIEDFLTLEQAGWKGRAASALGSAPATATFFRETLSAAHARGQACLTAITIDDRPIAMLATLRSGKGGYAFKTCFDEAYARFSPGVLLQRESLSILGAQGLDWIDSCAAQDHPMIDSLWAERRRVLHLSMPLPGATNRLVTVPARIARALWHGGKRLRGTATDTSHTAHHHVDHSATAPDKEAPDHG